MKGSCKACCKIKRSKTGCHLLLLHHLHGGHLEFISGPQASIYLAGGIISCHKIHGYQDQEWLKTSKKHMHMDSQLFGPRQASNPPTQTTFKLILDHEDFAQDIQLHLMEMATFVHKMSFIMLPLQNSKRSSALSLTWFQYKQLKGGWSGWIGSMIRSRMECMLMDMKEKMWCRTLLDFKPPGALPGSCVYHSQLK